MVLTITDRAAGYISNPVEYKDQTLIDLYGRRDASSTTADDICDPDVGAIVAEILGKREAYVRNTYKFSTHPYFIRCLPGAILTLTDPNKSFDHVRVRVTSVGENDEGGLDFECEEFPSLISTPTARAGQVMQASSVPDMYGSSGAANTPAIIEPSSAYTGGVPRVVIAASGGASWGGCTVHVSFNGTDYTTVGQITSPAIQGILTAGLASHADPDTTNTLSIDCTQSQGIPVAVSHADADALRTLALVAPQPTLTGGIYVMPATGELLAFGAVSTTGSYSADLSYLRRGEYGTAPAAHSADDQFTLVNILGNTGSSLSIAIPTRYIGQTIYFKLTSFNLFGSNEQDISTVPTYSYTPNGAGYGTASGGVPAVPTGLAGVTGA